jgi:hypothetical protein
MESFFGTGKDEDVGSTVYASHDEARLALFPTWKGITIVFVGIPHSDMFVRSTMNR